MNDCLCFFKGFLSHDVRFSDLCTIYFLAGWVWFRWRRSKCMSWLKYIRRLHLIDIQYDPDQEWWSLFANLACKRSSKFVTFQKPGTKISLYTDSLEVSWCGCVKIYRKPMRCVNTCTLHNPELVLLRSCSTQLTCICFLSIALVQFCYFDLWRSNNERLH